jgi:hypothetical protein
LSGKIGRCGFLKVESLGKWRAIEGPPPNGVKGLIPDFWLEKKSMELGDLRIRKVESPLLYWKNR